jgi:hypothetical protein
LITNAGAVSSSLSPTEQGVVKQVELLLHQALVQLRFVGDSTILDVLWIQDIHQVRLT